jgi:rubredoxin
MIRCSECGRIFDREAGDRSVASISGGIMGDEYIESYYFCAQCQVYTVEVYHDRFLGEEEISVRGPVPKTEGDALIELIKQCDEPWNKKCRCRAHQSYFQGQLD